MEITQVEQKKEENKFSNENSLKTNGITSSVLTFTLEGSQLEKKREKEAEHLFEEIIAENFSNLEKGNKHLGQKAQTVPREL